MHLKHLSLRDFRNYAEAELDLAPGVTTLVGRNGQGKTNVVEAAGYLAGLSSHRVSNDGPLVRYGAQQAIVRAVVVRDGREQRIDLEITPGRSNRARLGGHPVSRVREILGTVRTVLFAPEDLALVKGDPSERRRFLDDLLVLRQPRWSGVRSDYDKALKQRNALLKSAQSVLRPVVKGRRSAAHGDPQEAERALSTLEVWNAQLAAIGAALTYARLRLLHDLVPYLGEAYDAVSDSDAGARGTYRATLPQPLAERIASGDVPDQDEIQSGILEAMDAARQREVERGVTLVGPHRDDLVLQLGDLPAKGYASHGESWSFALGLRLAAFRLLRTDLRTDPVLILDDVFAELDAGRRRRLAGLVADCEQVIITAAVEEDVPEELSTNGRFFDVTAGHVARRGDEAAS